MQGNLALYYKQSVMKMKLVIKMEVGPAILKFSIKAYLTGDIFRISVIIKVKPRALARAANQSIKDNYKSN